MIFLKRLFTFLVAGTLSLLVVALAFSLFLGIVYSSPKNRPVGSPPSHWSAKTIVLQDTLPDSPKLKAWFVSPTQQKNRCILLLHGIKSHKKDLIPIAEYFRMAGYGVFLLDFRGHGESDPTPVTLGFREADDARLAVNWLRTNSECQKIAIWGQSMGGAAAVLAQPALNVDLIMLDSTYASIELAIKHRLLTMVGSPLNELMAPLLEWQLPLRLNIDKKQLRPVDAIQTIHVPLLILYGTNDRSAYPEEAQSLYQQAGSKIKAIWASESASHGQTHRLHHKEYERITLDFLAKHL